MHHHCHFELPKEKGYHDYSMVSIFLSNICTLNNFSDQRVLLFVSRIVHESPLLKADMKNSAVEAFDLNPY
jgi:hypothetical protein